MGFHRKLERRNDLKLQFLVKDGWMSPKDTFIPFELVRKEWKSKIGTLTDDGDLILEIQEVNELEFYVVIEALCEKTLKAFGGHAMPVSLSISK